MCVRAVYTHCGQTNDLWTSNWSPVALFSLLMTAILTTTKAVFRYRCLLHLKLKCNVICLFDVKFEWSDSSVLCIYVFYLHSNIMVNVAKIRFKFFTTKSYHVHFTFYQSCHLLPAIRRTCVLVKKVGTRQLSEAKLQFTLKTFFFCKT